MSWRDPWDRYKAAPKKPPPERGIKMKKSGATWWGQRWVEALERVSSNRLARGRTYARAGRTHDLVIHNGEVTAKVTGSRAKPYKVTISLTRLSDGVWNRAIAAMAEKAQFSAELLAGQMPQEIDTAFRAAGASIFPVNASELRTDCSCPDWANPCKHVAATHYVLGEALDRDPFLLFELRGRPRAQVLEALRAARAGEDDLSPRSGAAGQNAAASIPSVSLDRIKAGAWDTPPAPLPSLRLSFEPPPVSGGVLRQLGAPAGWSRETPPAELLGPMIRAAAERARALALAEGPTEPELATEALADAGRPAAKARASISRKTAVKRGAAATEAAGRKAAAKKAEAPTRNARSEQVIASPNPRKSPAKATGPGKASSRKKQSS